MTTWREKWSKNQRLFLLALGLFVAVGVVWVYSYLTQWYAPFTADMELPAPVVRLLEGIDFIKRAIDFITDLLPQR